MDRKIKLPPKSAIRLTRYEELRDYARAFAAGRLQNILLLGSAGIGKSQAFKDVLAPEAGWISGNASAFGIFVDAHRFRDQPLVFDDVDDLHRDSRAVRLLKSLCQSEARRQIQWPVHERFLESAGVPREFVTTSPIAVIANDWATLSLNVYALEDRMHVLLFEPSAADVHIQAAEWFWDQEIFDFVAAHLPLFASHSFRSYLRAAELKRAGLPWQTAVLANFRSPTEQAAARLRADPSFPSQEARAQAFVAAGHGCRATYFNVLRRLKVDTEVPAIKLRQPPAPPPCRRLNLSGRRR